MPGIILLMENIPSHLETWGRLLELSGYRVLKAQTLEGAEDILRRRWIHLAVMDMHMIDDDDPNDISGIVLASKQAYRHIPKIILTAQRDFEYMRTVRSPDENGLPAAVEYILKDDPPAQFLNAVKTAMQHNVRLNWSLAVHWQDDQPMTLAGLAGLIQPGLAPDLLPDRMEELTDLLRMLFPEETDLVIERVLWREGGRVTLAAAAYAGPLETTWAVTFIPGELGKMRLPTLAGIPRCRVARTHNLCASAVEIGAETVSAALLLREKKDSQTRAVLEDLLRRTLAPWYRQPNQIDETCDLAQLYQQALVFDPECLPEKIVALGAALEGRGLAEIRGLEESVRLQIRGGRPVVFPDPAVCLVSGALPSRRGVSVLSPGLGSLETILVDPTLHTWLTSVAETGLSPLGMDFAVLEDSVRSQLMPSFHLQERIDFEGQLEKSPGLVGMNSDIDPDFRQAWTVLQTLRGLALEEPGLKWEDYLTGLLWVTAAQLSRYDPGLPGSAASLERQTHRYLLCGLICKQLLAEGGGGNPDAHLPLGELRIDEDRHQVWVGQRRVELAGRPYELLLYLYQHLEHVCHREEIARDVFGCLNLGRDEKNLINKNIGRLRELVEPDRDHPHYVLTVRGSGTDSGYRLVLKPE